ncbi:uncharacterized protein LOC122534441 [Frieseomelitta varia]|uniref:uncharacterized protein LOC122534441 n=1 Tax=Frieseomelitta varia TaxID=561572 RepID=UPI001CB68EFD|nr:uncharacterized protein LOC122534441 [Frieseomelitta varia]
MDFVGYKYYRHLKFCFFMIGLTSYKSTQLRVVHTTIVCLILFLGSIFLMFCLMKNNTCTSQLFSFQTGIIVVIANVNIVYGLFLVKSVKIEDWLKDIKRDSNHIQDKEELKIPKTHVAMENRYAKIYLSKK